MMQCSVGAEDTAASISIFFWGRREGVAKLIRFGQIWSDLGEIWAKVIKIWAKLKLCIPKNIRSPTAM